MVNTAWLENNGYPVHKKWVTNFSNNVPHMLQALKEDINDQFEGDAVMPFLPKTKKNPKDLKKNIKGWKQWIRETQDVSRWLKTEQDDVSTSLEAWSRKFPTSHSYKRGSFPEQIIRFLKFNQQLNGFLPPTPGRAKFADFMGQDSRVRAYLNPYGSQSARWQPKATGFLPLKAAWMRSMILPGTDRFICGVDYASQEFLISALLSGDEDMLKAYKSGDVYLHTAKLAGAVPKNGTKKEYPEERNVFKAVTLGISYMMSCYGLSDTLSQVKGEEVDTTEAQEFIDLFFETYSDYEDYCEKIGDDYRLYKHIKLADGWTMFGDNDNERSYGNCPIQGMGSCILRKALDLSFERNLNPIMPLHDALYFEGKVSEMEFLIPKYLEVMRDAFSFYFKQKKIAHETIRLDFNVWGPGLYEGDLTVMENGEPNTGKVQRVYIDERAEDEFHRFKKYMKKGPSWVKM